MDMYKGLNIERLLFLLALIVGRSENVKLDIISSTGGSNNRLIVKQIQYGSLLFIVHEMAS